MKTKFYTILAFLFVTVSITAQIDRSQQPKPGPAPKISLEKGINLSYSWFLKKVIKDE